MAKFSRFGRKLVGAHLFIILLSIIVLAFSARVNIFTDWFYKADVFPFGLSVATIAVVGSLLLVDSMVSNAFTGRAQFEFIILGLLSLFWLAFNAFTTSRYVHVPFKCFSVIPSDQPEMRAWCVNIQVVKAFIWIVWVAITAVLCVVARFAHSEYSKGNRHVLKMALTRYNPHVDEDVATAYPFGPGQGHAAGNERESEFLQYEKALNHGSSFYQSQRAEPPSRLLIQHNTQQPDYGQPNSATHISPTGVIPEVEPIPISPSPSADPFQKSSAGLQSEALSQSFKSQATTVDGYYTSSYYAEASGFTPHYQKTGTTGVRPGANNGVFAAF